MDTIKTQTEMRDDLVAQNSFLNRRISDNKRTIVEQETQINANKDELKELAFKRKQFVESEMAGIKELIEKVKTHAKANL